MSQTRLLGWPARLGRLGRLGRVAARVVLVALLFALPAVAAAPRDPPQYDTFDADSLTIVDNFTKLEWDRRAVLSRISYGAAGLGCSGLTTLQNGGSSGRLPTVKELLTLLDEEPHVEYEFGKYVSKMIDALAFDGAPVDLPYWTSTPAGAGKVWTVSFSTGAMTAVSSTDSAVKGNARCVH
jgi:hypothetical protein